MINKLKFAAIALMCTAISANAATITGKLNFTGDVRVSATTIDFWPPLGPPDGGVNLTNTNTGTFVSGTTARVTDLTGGCIGACPVANFLYNFSAPNIPGLRFDLVTIFPGNFGAFNLNQTAAGAEASFAVQGIFTDGSASPVSNGIGIFSTQFTGESVAQVLAKLAAQGFVENSFSATFIANPVPEPGTMSIFAAGAALIVAGRAFRRNRKA